MSEHGVNVIEISEVFHHANAERLEIIHVNGWQAVVRKGDFAPGSKAIFIEPDYTVPMASPYFNFLDKGKGRERYRLKAVRLRGTLSYGLLIPVPEHLKDIPVGSDVMEQLGIERYVPPMSKVQAFEALPEEDWPSLYVPKFDVENLQKWPDMFQPSENVVVSEKLDGANLKAFWHNDQFYIGSRSQWLKNQGDHVWKRALDSTPQILEWCKANPSVILFGEAYGWVQSLRYGAAPGQVMFAAFAALDRGEWVDQMQLRISLNKHDVPVANLLYNGPYDIDLIKAIAEQDSATALVKDHMMEGVVIVPEKERRHPEIGRVALKLVSSRFWESDN